MTATNGTDPISLARRQHAVLESALPRAQKAVLMALLAYARRDLSVYHGQDRLAWACGYTLPTVNAAVHALRARQILRILKGHHPGHATEYQIDLDQLPTRPAYRPPTPVRQQRAQTSNDLRFEPSPEARQTSNDFTFETSNGFTFGRFQTLNSLNPNKTSSKQTKEPKLFLPDPEPPPDPAPTPEKNVSGSQSRGKGGTPPPVETPPPLDIPITPELEAWRDAYAPGLDLPRAIRKFLHYARAKGIRNADWTAAFCFYTLNGQDRLTAQARERQAAQAQRRQVDEARLAAFMAEQIAAEDAQRAADPAAAEWADPKAVYSYHYPCGTHHQRHGACPARPAAAPPTTDHTGPPEASTLVREQVVRVAEGVSGLGALLAAELASKAPTNGHGHHATTPATEEDPP
jgi:hypothetical protein